MSDPKGGGRVVFDFEGSLQLARQLWALATDLETEDSGRETEYSTASEKFQGPYSTEFTTRRSDERLSKGNVVLGLKNDARNWAKAWATALEQQNKNNRAAKVTQVREDRPWYEKGWDATFGEDDSDSQVAAARTVPIPTPPGFAPTATEQTF